MSKQQAEQIARAYIQSHRESFGNVSKKDIEAAVKKVAVALSSIEPRRRSTTSPSTIR